jgi:predicted nucleic acid-binding protein
MGVAVLDAGVLIGFLDADDPHHAAARAALAQARAAGDLVRIPASALAESLVGPARQGADAVARVQAFVQRLPLDVVPLDGEIALAAAQLRARHGGRLKLPDALVVATAQVVAADRLVTTDRGCPPAASLGLDAALVVI